MNKFAEGVMQPETKRVLVLSGDLALVALDRGHFRNPDRGQPEGSSRMTPDMQFRRNIAQLGGTVAFVLGSLIVPVPGSCRIVARERVLRPQLANWRSLSGDRQGGEDQAEKGSRQQMCGPLGTAMAMLRDREDA